MRTSPRTIDKKTLLALAGIVLVGAVCRLPLFSTDVAGLVTGKIVWFDEAYSMFFAGHRLADVIRFSGYDSSPGLFVVLLHFWQLLFGAAVRAQAALPFIFSLAALPLSYLAGREFFGRRAGLAAALLLALSPLHIKFAAEIRTYSLLFCLALLSLLFLRRFLESGRTRDGLWWAVFSVLGLYSHYTFLFFFGLENLYVLAEIAGRGFREDRKWLALLAGSGAACLPLVILFRRWGDLAGGGLSSSFFGRAFGHGGVISFLTYFATLYFGERRFYFDDLLASSWSVALGVALAAALAWLVAVRRRERGVRLAGFLVGGGILAFMAAGFIYDPRYYLIFAAPAILLAAAAFDRLRGWRSALAAGAVILALLPAVVGAWQVTPAAAFKYYAPYFAAKIERYEQPGDLVLVDHATDILFRLYYQGHSDVKLFFPRGGRNVTDMFERFRWFDYDSMSAADLRTLADLTAGYQRVWTVDYYPQRTSLQDPEGLKRFWFSRNFVLQDVLEFPPAGDGVPEDGQKALLLLYARP